MRAEIGGLPVWLGVVLGVVILGLLALLATGVLGPPRPGGSPAEDSGVPGDGGVSSFPSVPSPTSPAPTTSLPGSATTTAPGSATTTSPEVVDGPVVVFVGDSYGAPVEEGVTPWPELVGEELGWQVENLALPRTGYLRSSEPPACQVEVCPAYPEVVAGITSAPDAVVVFGGRIDGTGSGEAAGEVFADLAARFPDAQVVALPPWFDFALPPGILATRTQEIAQAAEQAGATYLETGQPFADRPDLLSDDGYVPTQEGHEEVAELLVPLLAEIVD